MVDQEDQVENSKEKDEELDNVIVVTKIDEDDGSEPATTLFAVRTTINQESNILRQIFYRFKILDSIPDIRAMLVSPLLPGYVFFEAPQKRSVQIAVQGIPHIKGRIVQNINLTELKHVLLPRSVTEYLESGDTVEIISGVFEGSRAIVMRMPHDTSSSEEVVVRLLQEETPITIKIHGDYLKLVEKKKLIEEPIPEIKLSDEEVATDLDKAISFDDDYDEYEEDTAEGVKAEKSEVSYDEDEEADDDDEWAKFDGF
ncbi:MAG: transcription elongation factor Spt5 [Candidatus Lokiarchaeota archaeon]|nr:transcription elongation factor Spt5 [Candidatus Lokiarchaeota archaeon]